MLDLIIVLLFIAYAIYSGFKSKNEAGQDLEQYFLAGKTLKGWKAGVSMAATQFAADTPLLVTGLIATGGIFLIWRLWIYGIAFLLMAFLFSTKWRRSGVITDAELVNIRYSGKGLTALRVLKSVYYGTMIKTRSTDRIDRFSFNQTNDISDIEAPNFSNSQDPLQNMDL